MNMAAVATINVVGYCICDARGGLETKNKSVWGEGGIRVSLYTKSESI